MGAREATSWNMDWNSLKLCQYMKKKIHNNTYILSFGRVCLPVCDTGVASAKYWDFLLFKSSFDSTSVASLEITINFINKAQNGYIRLHKLEY